MKLKISQQLKSKCVKMNWGINLEKMQEKIPEYENNETAPTFCNNFWTKSTLADNLFRMTKLRKLADESV